MISRHKFFVNKEQIAEALSIATLVGGTIVIPHLRRAYEYLDELEDNEVDVESFRINLGKVWESYST